MDTVNAAGCRDCIIIADKGFYSKKNMSALIGAGMRFILPLQDNTVSAEDEFYENTDDSVSNSRVSKYVFQGEKYSYIHEAPV